MGDRKAYRIDRTLAFDHLSRVVGFDLALIIVARYARVADMLACMHIAIVETAKILARGALLTLNYVFGGVYSVVLMIALFAGPYLALGGDAGQRSATAIALTLAKLLVLPAIGIVWFLYSNNVRGDRAKARILPLFWVIAIAVVAWFTG